MGVHPRTLPRGKGLGMKLAAMPDCRASSFTTRRTDINGIGHRQGVGVAKIDLVLSGRGFVLRVFDADTHLFEHQYRAATELARVSSGRKVEVAALIDRLGRPRGVEVLEVEEFDLGATKKV